MVYPIIPIDDWLEIIVWTWIISAVHAKLAEPAINMLMFSMLITAGCNIPLMGWIGNILTNHDTNKYWFVIWIGLLGINIISILLIYGVFKL